MDQAEERLIEEVRKYEHLYNSSSSNYKDSQMSSNSWREIAQNLGSDSADCMKRWKNLRDKFVRHRKKMASRSGDPGGKKVPAFYIFMSWLEPHVKHRETESNFGSEENTTFLNSETDSTLQSLSESSESPSPETPTPEEFASPQPQTSSMSDSFLSPTSPSPSARLKRRRCMDQGDTINKHLARLDERRLELQQRLVQDSDECSRFAQTVADMLRRVPESKRADLMYDIYTKLYENRE